MKITPSVVKFDMHTNGRSVASLKISTRDGPIFSTNGNLSLGFF